MKHLCVICALFVVFAGPNSWSQVNQNTLLSEFSKTMLEKGFFPLDSSQVSLSKLIQADQVWYRPESKKHVVAIIGDKIENWPKNQVHEFDNNFSYVLKHESGKEIGLGFYDGFTELEVEEIVMILKKTSLASSKINQKENQPNCNCTAIPPNQDLKKIPLEISSEDIFGNSSKGALPGPMISQAFSCLKDLVQGVWNSTGGQVVDGMNVITDPKKAWDEAHQVFKGVRQFVAEFENQMKSVVTGFSQLDRETIATLLCSIVGEMGGSALVSLLSGGAGVAQVLAKIKNYVYKIKQISSLVEMVGKFGESTQLRDRLNLLLRKVIHSEEKISESYQEEMKTFLNLKMPELAVDSLECAL